MKDIKPTDVFWLMGAAACFGMTVASIQLWLVIADFKGELKATVKSIQEINYSKACAKEKGKK